MNFKIVAMKDTRQWTCLTWDQDLEIENIAINKIVHGILKNTMLCLNITGYPLNISVPLQQLINNAHLV